MKQLTEALRGAKRIELLVIIAMLCTLLVLAMNSGDGDVTAYPQEERLERILSEIEGAGRVKVMLTTEDDVVQGCVVTAEGADDIAIMLKLQRAVQALTNLDLNRIEIVKSKR